ncbi:hypothetical protein Halru_2696 [Halovivax ruber XH-70]|uniref:DUF2071 domain-containing protein n=1 Tax=Halovivax ruber (strain DSM 18193 / JCM 13892 / XH-70) TaxID=797302 RepID=L0IGB8_HALRX|nr:DUF2071 domain-containing protein [Halovivax ruber]AGB17271.1 hypothetical protein Halru_2696 [Halovivax ruber XH-70]
MSRGDSVRETDRLPVSAGGPIGRLPHPFTLTWRDGLFLHWPVDSDVLRPHIPDPLALDTWRGRAWVSVVPFVASNAGIRYTPRFLRYTTAELNVRTYVTYRGEPGLYFFGVDVDSAAIASVVGRFTRLPVRCARMHVSRTEGTAPHGGNSVSFASTRDGTTEPGVRSGPDEPGTSAARFAVTYEPDDAITFAEPGTRAEWLTDRRRFYAPDGARTARTTRRPNVFVGEIAHAPWPLQSAAATLHENTLFAAYDLPAPEAEPIAQYCPELRMTASIPRRVRDR